MPGWLRSTSPSIDPGRAVCVHQLLGQKVVGRRPAFNRVACERERSTCKSYQRNLPVNFGTHHPQAFQNVTQLSLRIRIRSPANRLRTPQRVTEDRPGATRNLSPSPPAGRRISAKMIAASTANASTGWSVTWAAISGVLNISIRLCFSRMSRYAFIYLPAWRINHTGCSRCFPTGMHSAICRFGS